MTSEFNLERETEEDREEKGRNGVLGQVRRRGKMASTLPNITEQGAMGPSPEQASPSYPLLRLLSEVPRSQYLMDISRVVLLQMLKEEINYMIIINYIIMSR